MRRAMWALGVLGGIGCGTEGADSPVEDVSGEAEVGDAGDADSATPALVLPPDPGHVTSIAGDSLRGHADGVGREARLQGVTALCAADGVIFASDTFAGTLRRIDPESGAVETLAGQPGRLSLSDGPAAEARFASPRGLACLPDGLLVADSGALRRVAADGTTETVAGFAGSPGDADGPATEARLGYLIHAMVAHPDGRVFLSDRSNDALKVVDTVTWSVSTLTNDLNGPGGLAVDPRDPSAVLVADTFSDRVVRVSADGTVTALPLVPAPETPQALAADGDRLWVAGFGPELRGYDLVTGESVVVTDDFPGTFASFALLPGEAAALFYAALEPEAVRRLDVDSGRDALVAGATGGPYAQDGPVARASFGLLSAVAAHEATLFFGEEEGLRRLREGRVDTVEAPGLARGGLPLAVAGLAVEAGADRLWASAPEAGRVVALGLGALARGEAAEELLRVDGLGEPAGLAVGVGAEAVVVVAERGGHRLLRLSASGEVTPFAGSGTRGTVDGALAEARLDGPHALAWDAARGHLWVGQLSGHLRRVDVAQGRVETILGPGGVVAGPVGTAQLGLPLGLVAGDDLLILDAEPGALLRLRLAGGAPVALETVAGGLLGGGLPRGARVPLGEAILGLASGGVRVGQDLLVTAEHAVYRVHFGDGPRETGGGATMSATCAHALTVTPALPTPGATGAEPIGMTLERGPQGLQHVTLDLAVAREALAAGLHATTLALLFDGEARPRAQATLTLPWQAAGSETRAEGILFVIEDPAAVLGAELTLAVVVGPPEAAACARERVHLAW